MSFYIFGVCVTLYDFLKNFASAIISLVAFVLSLRAFQLSLRNSRINVYETLLKMALDKSKDCNKIWLETDNEFKKNFPISSEGHSYSYKNAMNEYNTVIDEIIISRELLRNSYKLFDKKSRYLKKQARKIISYAFWKQLTPDLRGFITQRAPVVAVEKYNRRTYYSNNLLYIYEFTHQAWENDPEVTFPIFKNLYDLPDKDQIKGDYRIFKTLF